ncbi:hypothetical protein [Nostoc sp.]
MSIGQSLEHLDFPGSLALSPDILLEIFKQLTANLTAVPSKLRLVESGYL